MRESAVKPGRVFFVGAGPGDPDLLTVKAARLLAEAEVVVYDRLVSPEILALIPATARRVYVGKTAGFHPVPQDRINEMLAELAREGRPVVRLKGGDPFIFGRGSEEAEHLLAHGIPFEVIPGITAASGCAAAIGVPLTHRGLATGVRFVTGHCKADEPLDLDWAGLAHPETTLVVYMGKANIAEIRDRLIGAGLAPETPAVAIAEGTTPRQRTCFTRLGELPERLAASGLGSAVLLVIGRVVALADQLAPDGALKAGRIVAQARDTRYVAA
ncbi:MAG: uroporphyrinogen-III C-methyltransferase [Alphaproteobacteria bacterium]|nr:uroporphyrinogen-III C-methyltransferase [Alphaproteobacteria bacterium]